MFNFKNQILFLVAGFNIFCSLQFVGCNRAAVSPKSASTAQTSPVTSTKEKCETRWFDSASNNPRCYKLQQLLITGALDGDIKQMKDALTEGANVEAGYQDSYPALYTAAMAGQKDAVTLLLDNGANINRILNFRETALKQAVFSQRPEVVKILIQRGADVCVGGDSKKGEADSALNIALEKKNQEIINLLESAGARDCHS